MDADGAHAGDPVIAEKGLGRRQPEELDPFLLGVGDLAHGSRHVGVVAAVQAFDRFRALAHRRTHAVHRRIAGADDHDVLADGVERPVVELRHPISQPLAVRRRQIVHRREDVAKADPGHGEIARGVDAGGDQHGVMLDAQLFEAGVAADLEVEMELDAASGQKLGAAFDDVLFELEIGDAVHQQAAGTVVAVIDVDLVALAAQLLRRRHAARPGADDAYRLVALAERLGRLDPAHLPGRIGDVLLDGADAHGPVAGLFEHAIALAQAVLGADAAADLGKIVGRGRGLVGLLEPALGRELEPVGNVVLHRAVDLAERDAALRATRGLLPGPLGIVIAVDLVEVATALPCLALVGHPVVDGDEFQHLRRHSHSLGSVPHSRRPRYRLIPLPTVPPLGGPPLASRERGRRRARP